MSAVAPPSAKPVARPTETVYVPVGMMRSIKAHCVENMPYESCGVIGGGDGYLMMLARCGNDAMNPKEAFFVKPHHQFVAETKFKAKGMRIVAMYHSHPSAPARPSQADLDQIPTELVSLIYSVADDEIKAWRGTAQVNIEVIR